MEQVTSKSTNRDLLFFLLCTFTSFVLLLGLKNMLNLHLNAGPVCGGFSGIPQTQLARLRRAIRLNFMCQQFLPSHPGLASPAHCVIMPGTSW